MYRELFSVTYHHEYFDGSDCFQLHCKLSQRSNELTKAADAVLIARKNGFKYLWSSSRYSRDELLAEFSGTSLVVYLTPMNPEQFFNITDQYPIAHQYTKKVNGRERNTSCLYLHYVHAGQHIAGQLIGFHQPVDKLPLLACIEQLDNLEQLDLHTPASTQSDAELQALYQIARRKPMIAMIVPFDQLDKDRATEFRLSFNARSVFFKYYFMNLKDEQQLTIRPQLQQESTSIGMASFTRAEAFQDKGRLIPTFVSDVPIKLKHKPEYSYQLTNNHNGVEEVILDALPQPNVQQYFKHTHPQQGPITVLEAFIK